MPSSPTLPAETNTTRHERLLAALQTVPDPRDRRGVRYSLAGMLALAVTATVAGCRSFAAIGQWAAETAADKLACFGLTSGSVPDESTLRKLFARLDADALDRALGTWMWTRTFTVEQRRVIALDGKTVRGARTRPDGKAPHLVAAFDHGAGAVLGQVGIDAKSNEIPAVRTLLGQFDLDGAVVTLDAMHTQTDTATAITGAGGDYVFTVKANMPGLHQKLKKLPWKDMPAHTARTAERGRRVTRTIKVADVPDWIDFPGAAQVAHLRRTLTDKATKTVEVVCLITSASHTDAPPQRLAAWVQNHWGIQNRLHWVRDVTFDEDRSQVRTGQAPRVMATCRNLAISILRIAGWDNIAAGLRHHARHPDHALTLVLTS
ncbi:ISAs1 family transposase [Mycobacterium helveticum]|uniref:ISAs1 family transposase n=1 Tax=Mycobacterium helveticum TaxID=2592811 RepID=UPI001FE61176|nr:ISAs1 family transposase [Mycobacterium helveticum]